MGDLSPAEIDGLMREHRPGGPMVRELYCSPAVFAADMERIFQRHWLYVAHSCMLPKAGDWLTWRVGDGSVVVTRGEDGQIRAFHNSCRHRGARICREASGNGRALVCPYHRWTYSLDGQLKNRTMEEFGVAESTLGLRPVALRDVAGLLFISFADDPPDFDRAAAEIAPKLKPHGMDRAKVAKWITYDVKANWKLVWENNRECYHCAPNHPEYVKATYDVARDDPRRAAEVQQITAEANARFRRLGLDEGSQFSTMSGAFWRANRAPLMKGFVTQSLDGKPVAPLMGDIKERDAGTLRMIVYPNFWQHASDDHAVATRITPIGPGDTKVDVIWLVDQNAVEGRDYTLDRLLPVWQLTSEQDWFICEENQAGVSSLGYVPGPYAKTLETNVGHFVGWYLNEMAPPARPSLKAVGA